MEEDFNLDDIMTTFEDRFCQSCVNFWIDNEDGWKRFKCTVCKERPYPKYITVDKEGNPICKYFKEI